MFDNLGLDFHPHTLKTSFFVHVKLESYPDRGVNLSGSSLFFKVSIRSSLMMRDGTLVRSGWRNPISASKAKLRVHAW